MPTFLPLHHAGDDRCDIDIDPDRIEQYVVWAVGGLGVTAFKHFNRAERNNWGQFSGKQGGM